MKGVPPDMAKWLTIRLDFLNRATILEDLNLLGWNLHSLKGQHKGEHAITVTANQRITFRFENGEVRGVNLEDYHLKKDFLNGRKRRPTHPGAALREDLMPAAGINQAQLAKALGVSRLTISEIVLEKASSGLDFKKM